MKTRKIFSKRLLLLFSAAALGCYGILLACAGGFSFDYEDSSNFAPEAFVKDASYAPLFFTTSALFYSREYLSNENLSNPSRFNENIINDWSAYLQNRLPQRD